MDELIERLTELEIRYTHQANLIEELNDELTRANERIGQLEREGQMFREMLSSLAPESEVSPDE